MNRRVAMQWISSAMAAIPLLEREAPAAERSGIRPKSGVAKGYGPDPDLMRKYKPGDLWPLTFSKDQRRLVIVLCDIIMPADKTSPSASMLGVHDFVDEWISSPYPAQKGDRNIILKGLSWLDEEAGRRNKANFISLNPKNQLAICQDLARKAKADSRRFPGSFFYRLRNLVAGGYYTTPAGMKDIGYLGNVPQAEWNGPPEEVLKKLNLPSQ
ncbi:MAG TPA: gluconate 2-dehydrogenase subunit 3 family protein [Verrucomicrobia bacterium]|nr:gluconate 2-dehydrogenase subunit 3 family protein [Verrucomicrobiota bacterium]